MVIQTISAGEKPNSKMLLSIKETNHSRYSSVEFKQLVWRHSITNDVFNSVYDLWAGNVRCWILGEVTAWSSHCPFMLEEHFFPPNPWDICFVTSWQWRQLLWKKKHNGAGIVNTDTAHPLTITGFHQKDCNFQGDNTNRQGDGGKKHVKHAHSNFNQPGRPWGWLTKWQKKTSSLLKRHVSLQSPWHDQRKTGGGALYLCCKVNMLCTNWEPLVFG